MASYEPKTYSSTFLYGKYDYDKTLIDFIMKSEVIDKKSNGFDDIIYEVKHRQEKNILDKVLVSNNVKLLISNKPLARSFNVFCAKDIKGINKNKIIVYINCRDIIYEKNNKYMISPNKIDSLISHLVSALIFMIYYKDPKRFLTNHNIVEYGAKCFSKSVVFIIDYLAKISSLSKVKDYCSYLSSQYYISNILGLDRTTDTNRTICEKISSMSRRESDIIEMDLEESSFDNVKTFTEALSKILHIPNLTVDILVNYWIMRYGSSTVYGLELFPAFATMITDCYVGGYLNMQKTIEKVCSRDMIVFSKEILKIGDGVF